MGFNVSGWGTVPAGKTMPVRFWINNGQDFDTQVAMGKPEGAALDGSSNGALVSFDSEIDLDISSGAITYVFQLKNLTESDTSFMLCGGGLS